MLQQDECYVAEIEKTKQLLRLLTTKVRLEELCQFAFVGRIVNGKGFSTVSPK